MLFTASRSKEEEELFSCIALSLSVVLSEVMLITFFVLWTFSTPDAQKFVMFFVYGMLFWLGLGFILMISQLIAESYILIKRKPAM